jgi:hypothetical protein
MMGRIFSGYALSVRNEVSYGARCDDRLPLGRSEDPVGVSINKQFYRNV